jgi:hypothetical protein
MLALPAHALSPVLPTRARLPGLLAHSLVLAVLLAQTLSLSVLVLVLLPPPPLLMLLLPVLLLLLLLPLPLMQPQE